VVAAGGVHDDARGLVDHQQVLVAVGHLVRRVRNLGRRRLRRLLDGHDLARAQAVALRRGPAVDEHRAGLDEPLRARPRAQRPGEERVEPRALVLRRRAQLHLAGAR
jgi:hypothetical protein